MNRFVLFPILLLCAVQAVSSQNVTVLPDNVSFMVNQSVSQFRINIRHVETQVELLRLHFQNLLEAISSNSKLIDRRYQRFEAELYRSAIISLDYSSCVGRYQSDFLPVSNTLQSQVSSCVSQANSNGYNLGYQATSNINYAKSIIDYNLRNDVNNCVRSNQTERALTSCVNSRIINHSRTVDIYLTNAEREVISSFCRAEQIAKEAQNCVFEIIINAGSTFGNVSASVENCLNSDSRCAV